MCFRHLKEKNIGYCDHLKQAWWLAWEFTKVIPKMLLHGLYPDVCEESASELAEKTLETTHPGWSVLRPDRKKPF